MIERFDPLEGKMLRILDADGRCDETLRPDLDDEQIRGLYGEMVFLRAADNRALALQRQGRLGTYAPFQGQEAAQMGSALALGKEDWVFPSFREMAVFHLRGVPLSRVFLYWMGNEMGHRFPEDVRVFPISIPVGSHGLHAVGAAWAAKLRGERVCTVAYLGDGATSEGDFHEALNFAGVLNTPTIFIIQNNQYAISVPRKIQTASKTIAQKAVAYGFPGVQVDGNDLLAMYAATQEARERALSGQGPTLIEAVTYRMGPHTTADDPTKYRREEEVAQWRPLDPLVRLKKYLASKDLWSEAWEEEVTREAVKRVNELVAEAEGFAAPEVDDIFQYTLAKMTPTLSEQRDAYLPFVREKGE